MTVSWMTNTHARLMSQWLMFLLRSMFCKIHEENQRMPICMKQWQRTLIKHVSN